jgi:predicted RNA methylase
MTPDDIAAAAIRNWHARQGQIGRLRPRQALAVAKREEMRTRAEHCKGKEQRAQAFERVKTIPNFFPTPPRLVEKLIGLAGLRPGLRVLEPSCGKGDLALPILSAGCVLECVERSHELAEMARGALSAAVPGSALCVRCDDFLSVTPQDYAQRFDRVVMNPPFDRGSARLHVLHAFEFLAPGGELVAIVDNMTAHRLGEWCDFSEPLPAGSFEASERPTSVNTAIIQKSK